jgi:transposase-like protein
MNKTRPAVKMIRYSKSFKLSLVKELEGGEMSACAMQRKYQIRGNTTLMRWVKQYGCGKYGKVIRVEKFGEVNEAVELRKVVSQLKEALADAHVDLALEKAYLEVACEELNESLEVFKKKHAGRRRTKR